MICGGSVIASTIERLLCAAVTNGRVMPTCNHDRRYVFQDDLSKIAGRHNFKFGAYWENDETLAPVSGVKTPSRSGAPWPSTRFGASSAPDSAAVDFRTARRESFVGCGPVMARLPSVVLDDSGRPSAASHVRLLHLRIVRELGKASLDQTAPLGQHDHVVAKL